MSSSALQPWWEDAVTSFDENYISPAYSIPSSAKTNHDLFGEYRNNDFDTDGNDWGEHIFIITCSMLAIGLIFFIVCPFIYMFCLSDRSNCCSKTKEKRIGGGGTHFLFWVFLVFSGIGIALSIFGFYSMGEDTMDLGNYSSDASFYLKQVQSTSSIVVGSAENLKTTITTEIGKIEACIGAVIFDENESFAELNNLISEVEALSLNQDIEDAIKNLDDVSESSKDNDSASITFNIAYGVLNFICFMGLALLAIAVTKSHLDPGEANPMQSCIRCTTLLLAFFLISISWLFLVSSTTGALVTGDFCQDPQQYTTEYFDNNEVVQFYATCEGSNTIMDAIILGEIYLFESAKLLSDSIESANVQPGDVCATVIDEARSKILTSGYSVKTSLDAAIGLAECETINSIYVDAVYNSLCDDVNRSLQFVMIGLLIYTVNFVICIFVWRLMVAQAEAEQPLIQRQINPHNSSAYMVRKTAASGAY